MRPTTFDDGYAGGSKGKNDHAEFAGRPLDTVGTVGGDMQTKTERDSAARGCKEPSPRCNGYLWDIFFDTFFRKIEEIMYTNCLNNIARNIAQDCDAPLLGGYSGMGVLVPADSNYTVTQNSSNPRLVEALVPENESAIVVDNVSVAQPFAGSTTASNTDSGVRAYAKTISFRIPLRGAAVSKELVEPLASGKGFVLVVEKDDRHHVDGRYEVIGLQSPLKVTADGVQRTESENGGAILVTMACTESWFESTLVGAQTDGEYTQAGAKAAFDAMVAKAV